MPSHRKRKLYKVVERYRRNATVSFDLAPSTSQCRRGRGKKNNDGVSVYISINLSEVDSHLHTFWGWSLMKKNIYHHVKGTQTIASKLEQFTNTSVVDFSNTRWLNFTSECSWARKPREFTIRMLFKILILKV